ncbi:NAD(P)-dependent oxidoreductase [Paenibacillus aceris]|uniref:Phosphoglycerate dehydrogenase-like enzyme n=1 Tax=Paenibacillus aceris TaxID=869555 RepID=A0ABS4I8B5_9BACL|nr:NAD(P)-dependent oxidoreductase [Paenibacillus aceris]MBP1967167.1 phosphoglycerate dehydrogenase-like enzyme [Paenibacillus aceris]NHW35565.1 hypothetical protein [Paenibacillus aceris]
MKAAASRSVDIRESSEIAEGMIAGAGLDVLSIELLAPDHPLIQASNCIITLHMEWATRTSKIPFIGFYGK